MKIRKILPLCIIIILSCVGCLKHSKNDEDYNCTNNAVLIESKNYEGVIFSEYSDWSPSEEDIKQFEIGLEDYLNDLVKSDGVNEDGISYSIESLKYIIKNIKSYKRQYMGLSDTDDTIYCHMLLIPKDEDFFDNWQSELIHVSDGGANFFYIYFDVKSKKYFDLLINGIG